jgi:Contractile injection system tube protein
MTDTEPTKAQLYCLDKGSSITFRFNPTTFKFTRKVDWTEGQTAAGPWTPLSFSHGSSDTLNVVLLLDETEPAEAGGTNDASTLDDVIEFYKLTMPVKVTQGSQEIVRPPVVAFLWERFQFQGVITSLDVDLQLFDDTGRAKRATVTIDLLGRALAGASSTKDFFDPDYAPPSVSSSGGGGGDDERLNILDEM